MSFLTWAMPPWMKYAAIALAAVALYLLGRVDGARIEGAAHLEYVAKQSTQTLAIAKAQIKEVVRTEIEYRDRTKTIYVKGDVIEREVPVYVTQADNDRCTINAGFVRSYNAAWTGEPAGPAAESDREPAGISLSEVGEADAFNAKVCRAWREKALGIEALYRRLQAVTNHPDS
jgi:hypothetical protein